MSDVRSYFLGNYLVHQHSTRTLVFITFVKLCVYFTSFISPVRLFFFLLFIYGYFTMKKKIKLKNSCPNNEEIRNWIEIIMVFSLWLYMYLNYFNKEHLGLMKKVCTYYSGQKRLEYCLPGKHLLRWVNKTLDPCHLQRASWMASPKYYYTVDCSSAKIISSPAVFIRKNEVYKIKIWKLFPSFITWPTI